MNQSDRIQFRNDQQIPPMPDERLVDQYGPEWMAHVSLGGNVRNGNILCLPLVPVR
jgi:hypothetical protein